MFNHTIYIFSDLNKFLKKDEKRLIKLVNKEGFDQRDRDKIKFDLIGHYRVGNEQGPNLIELFHA